MSELKVDKLSPRTGTALTLGDSGDTITLAAGATAVGFGGITKSASDPAVDTNPAGGVGTVFLNTTSGEMYSCTDATAGANVWVNTGEGSGNISTSGNAQSYMSATGGTITTDGSYKVHTFLSSGTFTPSIGTANFGDFVEYLVIAGGGSGGTYTSGSGYVIGNQGSNSVFSTFTSIGGGYGGKYNGIDGGPGGSGGGGGYGTSTGGAPTAGQGFAGGDGGPFPSGGGGAGAVGVNATLGAQGASGAGGAGLASSIDGSSVTRAGGGGGGAHNSAGAGGLGGGGAGGAAANGTAGTVNMGGGGGGADDGGGAGLVVAVLVVILLLLGLQ